MDRAEGLKLADPYPVDSDINEGWEVIDYKTSDEKEISSSVRSKIPPTSTANSYPADDLLKLIGAGQTEIISAACTIS